MQLTHFALYDKTSAQSVITYPCTLINMYGNYNGAGAEFLQVFDKATAAVANDVPVISLSLASAGPGLLPSFFEALGAHVFANGISVGISTVNEKYTASGSSFDIEGDVEEQDDDVLGLTTFSSSNVGELEIWNDAAGPKNLYDLTIVNGEGVIIYPFLFAVDLNSTAAGHGQPALAQLDPIAIGATRTYNFGHGGRLMMQKDLAYVDRKSCYVSLSTSPLNVSTSQTAASTISGHYKST